MARDLRELFKEEREKQRHFINKGHEARFLERLENELPQKRKSSYFMLKIAATILVLLCIGIYGYKKYNDGSGVKTILVDKNNETTDKKEISLGDLSPDLKKVENYYVANINLALSKLEVSENNKILVGSFMDQMGHLNTEYEKLNQELNQMGPNDQTISALIQNLQLRLQLLQKLKKKLNELKTSKNEHIETNVI